MRIDYKDSVEEAGQIARSAIPFAAKLGLPINPYIYTLCYQHTAKTNDKLSNALIALLASSPTPTKSEVEELYHQFVVDDDSKAVQMLKTAVDNVMSKAQVALLDAQNSSTVYEQQLGTAGAQLDDSGDQTEIIEAIVKNLIAETTQMSNVSTELREKLTAAQTEIAHMHEEFTRVRQESLTDPLTGLKNRRAFDDAFKTLSEQALELNTPMSLLVIDIDHFKRVNDTHGHIVGDAVLKCIGNQIKNVVRGNDVSARFGGEEFVLLLPDTPLVGAERVAENIRESIAKQTLRHGDHKIGQVTVSVGYACFNYEETIEDLFERTDAALYEAKIGGRNQVCGASG
jgi:diguanylate cyclase (GGDEF) domain